MKRYSLLRIYVCHNNKFINRITNISLLIYTRSATTAINNIRPVPLSKKTQATHDICNCPVTDLTLCYWSSKARSHCLEQVHGIFTNSFSAPHL